MEELKLVVPKVPITSGGESKLVEFEGTCSVEASRYKTLSRNVVLVESVST